MTTSSRKLDHIRICLEKRVESELRPFQDLELVHRALPEMDMGEVDTSCRFLGRWLSAPLLISAMTGGHPGTREINASLAQAAQETRIALGIGSQRAALEDPQLEESFSVVREAAPDVAIIGNIGAAQLRRYGPEVLDRLKDMIDADAIAIHLNFLQECIQPEGDTKAKGVVEALRSLSRGPVPLIVKETGAGISREVAEELLSAGVRWVDVSGTGGTSWSGVESYRALEVGDLESAEMGKLFWSWGLPTPASVVECVSSGLEVIASGGIRSGIDAAKSIALGASLAGAALPLLSPATRSPDEVSKVLRAYIRALRICMFLTGSRSITGLQSSPIIIAGRTREWLEQRGYNTAKFSSIREMAR
jgi:isopentenyl-diphosphate delta-isomerase